MSILPVQHVGGMPQNKRVTSNQSGASAGAAHSVAVGSAARASAGTAADPQPHRGSLGLVQGTALYIASVLGTGILVLPGLAAAAAGPASIVAVAAVLVLSIPLAGTFAALASRYPDAGGVASFVRRALGGTAARMAGYWFFFGVCVGAPVLAILGGEYVVAVLGVDRAAVPIIGFAIFVPPFITNWFGVRVAGWVQFVLTGLLIAVVVGVVAVTFPAVDTSNFTPFLPNGWGGVGIAISLFVWAFAGWEVGTHISGEFRNPRRTIPLATAIAVVVVGAGYLALQFVTVAVLGDNAGDGQVPLLDLVETTAPGIGTVLVAVVAAIVTLGVMNAYLPAFGKLGAALGRDGDLPRFFAKGAADGEIPRRALALTGVLIIVYFVLMLLNGLDLTAFILIHTSNMVAIYTAGMLAATLLLERWSFGWWLAVVATIMTAGLLVLAWANLIVPLVLAAAAVAVTVVRRVQAKRRGKGAADASASAAAVEPAPALAPAAAATSDHAHAHSASARAPLATRRPTPTPTIAEESE
jgi:amino acid efflux transporter